MGKDWQDLDDEELEQAERELQKRRAENGQSETQNSLSGTTKGCLFAIGIFMLLGLILWGVSALGSGSGGAGSKVDKGSNTGAYVVCKDFVEMRLKAPSTAEFSRMYDSDVEKVSGNYWKVESYVDAENSFGAMVRTYFTCEVTYQGDDNWHLEELETY